MFETDEEEWVEISDGEGQTAALRHLAMVRDGEKTYHILGAFSQREDGEGEGGLLLVREDRAADGVQEYVLTSDENEVQRVIGGFVMHAMAVAAASMEEEGEEAGLCPCGTTHAPGEFCFCDDPDMLQ